MIAQARPDHGPLERQALDSVWQRQALAQGPEIVQLEQALSTLVGTRAVVSCASGFAGLHLALMALKLPRGSQVIVPCISSCAALREAVGAAGCTPIFAEVLADSPNLDPQAVSALVGPNTGAILCPHHFGRPAELQSLLALGIPLIEDCAQAVGGNYAGRPLGSWGCLGVFSFFPTKLIASVDGGAISCHDGLLEARLRQMRYYAGAPQVDPELSAWNYKLANLNAALAEVQVARLPAMLQRRRALASRLRTTLLDLGCPQQLLLPPLEGEVAFRFGLRCPPSQLPGVARAEYLPLCPLDNFPRGRAWVEEFSSLPCYSALRDEEVETLIQELCRWQEIQQHG